MTVEYMTYKTALVTGGAGFIGSHIVDALIRRRIKVFVVDDLSTGSKENLNPNAEFMKISIASPRFPEVVKKISPDIIFHLAAQIDVRKSVALPLADARVNILGTLHLIEAAKDAKVKKIVFSSSGGAMYSDAVRPPYNESVSSDPISPYGIAKRAGEMYFAFAQSVYGISCVTLRYANVYGPRQSRAGEAGVVAIFASKMLEKKSVVINGTGRQTRDFVYVDDVVRANMLAMAHAKGGIFHIGTSKQTDINKMFRMLKHLTNFSLPERHAPASPGEVMRSALSAKKARAELGWEPQVDLDDGLERTVEWFKKR